MKKIKGLLIFLVILTGGSIWSFSHDHQDFNNPVPQNQQTDKWKLTPPCFVIAVSTTSDQFRAKKEVSQRSSGNIPCGYLWIPEYGSLSRKQLYCIYIGPFSSEKECASYLEKYKKTNSSAYGVLVAHTDTRIEIRGIGNVVRTNSRYPSIQGIYPQGSMERLLASGLTGLILYEIKIMKNEILARHGNKFKTATMIEYFSQQSWYVPKNDDVTNLLSEVEKSNIAMLAVLEKKSASGSSSRNSRTGNQQHDTPPGETPPPPPPPPGENVSSTEEIIVQESPKEEYHKDNGREIFTVVEEQPGYPGGDEPRIRFLQENIIYPEEAKETGAQGKVYVTFVVETDGSLTDVRVLRGVGYGCDEEAVRVIKAMPKWIPGRQRGVPVRVQFNLPIKFTLP